MVALVTDALDRPVSVVRHSIGTSDGASVHAGVLTGATASTEGAAKVSKHQRGRFLSVIKPPRVRPSLSMRQ